MRDRAVLALVVGAALGAWWAPPVPPLAGLALALGALVARRPVLLVVGTTLLAGGLSARATAGLAPPPAGEVAVVATLVTDPEDRFGAVRVELRTPAGRVEGWARGAAAAALRPRLAGERVAVAGRLRPLPEAVRARLAPRHLRARLDVREVGDWSAGTGVARSANAVRRTLERGASPLGDDARALFAGLVLGDDRGQSDVVADDFRAAGLSHLLAVSGQNVAFALALAGPVLSRSPLRWRAAGSLAVIGAFGVLTRWEPSVLRASALAALAVLVTTAGRPTSRLRLLALAVTGLLLLDPLLVHALGFRLSVAATVGIALLAAPIARRMPGPRPLAQAVALTVAAEIGVAPVLLPVFGTIPLVAVPANVLAAPVAGPVMAWGLTGGAVAGLVPALAPVLHAPTSVLLWWLAGVARVAAGLPLGALTSGHAVALAGAAAVAVALRSVGAGRRRPRLRVLPAAVALVVVLHPVAVRPAGAVAGAAVAPGATLWRSGGAVVVVLDGAGAGPVLEGLRRAGVRRIDVLVTRRGGATAAGVVLAVRRRLDVGAVLAPQGHRVRDARTPAAGAVLRVGDLAFDVAVTRPTLDVAARSRG